MSASLDQRSRPSASGVLAGVAVYTMFSGDPTQLLQWCNFHLNAGADRLYVMLDRPSPELLQLLPDTPDIHWHAVDQETWSAVYPPASRNVERKQVDGFRQMARLAVSHGHEYLAFVDADELIMLYEPFSDIAARFPEAPVFRLKVREMWYDDSTSPTEPFAATLALSRPTARRVDWNRAFGWRAQFLRNGLLGHDAGKSIYRLPLAAGELSVHTALSPPVVAKTAKVPSASGGLLHYDCGSVATWNMKWSSRLAGSTVATGKVAPQRWALQRLFSHELRQPPEVQETFFRDFFSLDQEAQNLLDAEGILERLDVRETTSGPLPLGSASTRPAATALTRLPDPHDRVDFQFAFVCDKRFVKPTFATMTSVLAQVGDKGSVRFVVLGDGLDATDFTRLRALEHTPYDVQVVVHDITADLDQDVGTEDAKRATFGRIYLIDYLPEQRTVYLDGDVLATRDFTELFALDLGTACLAGVSDSAALRIVANPTRVPIEQRNRLVGITNGEPLEYLNGGVLIFDLDNPDFRALALQARALVVMQGPALKQRDQDALNLVFSGRKYRLESKYNYMTQFYASDRCLDGDLVRLKYDAADASLIHFSGKTKPWESPTDEFYNGLYRRLVAAAEEQVGVSCEFYFSKPAPPARHHWPVQRWVETLGSAPRPPAPPKPSTDIAIVDLCDEGAYLKLSSKMYELVRAGDLRLVAYARGETLFEVPLERLSPQQSHLSERVTPALRTLPFDLATMLADCDGVARHVEFAVASRVSDTHVRFERWIGVIDVLAAGTVATSDLLHEAGIDGALEAVSDGWLTGWVRPHAEAPEVAISLYIDGELAAQRLARPTKKDPSEEGHTRAFRFNVANLIQLGYGQGGDVSVGVSATTIPLRGSPLRISDAGRELRFDAARDTWVQPPREPNAGRLRVRRGLRRAVVRIRDRVRPKIEGSLPQRR
ncbi:MAG TPA: glycosyltransferase [Nocardioidaceae bacterium]|nr:glycosyltransferase [Nocardioidaceae bacterium]